MERLTKARIKQNKRSSKLNGVGSMIHRGYGVFKNINNLAPNRQMATKPKFNYWKG